jgi:hypothetical protein
MARKDAPDRVVILASVVGQFSRIGRTGSIRGRVHQRCPSVVLGIWINLTSREVFNKVEVGHVARIACIVQGR